MCQKCRDLAAALDRGDVPGAIGILLRQSSIVQDKQDAAMETPDQAAEAGNTIESLRQENARLTRQVESLITQNSTMQRDMHKAYRERDTAEQFALQVGSRNRY